MATLKEQIANSIKLRRKSLKEVLAAQKMVELLPEEVQELNGDADTGWCDCDLKISFYQSINKEVDLLRLFKTIGAIGFKLSMSNPDNWYTEGTFIVGDNITVKVSLGGLPNPPECRIEAYEEMVTKYKAICTETEEAYS